MTALRRLAPLFASVLLAVTVSISAAAQPAPPTLAVDPATDLVDGQQVAISGSGYRPGADVRVRQCPTGADDLSACDRGGMWSRTVDGRLDGVFRVRTILRLDGRTVDCRQAGACFVGIGDDDAVSTTIVARAALHFDPDGPLAPPPTLAVVPSKGLDDGQTVAVTGSGWVRVQHGLDGGAVMVVQCAADLQDFGDCDPSTSRSPQVDADAALATEMPVYARIETNEGRAVDCRVAGQCVLAATSSDFASPDEVAVSPLSFDPDGSTRSPRAITVTPAVDLVDGQVVRVDGSGFDRPWMPFAAVYQCAPSPSSDRCHLVGSDVEIGSRAGLRHS